MERVFAVPYREKYPRSGSSRQMPQRLILYMVFISIYSLMSAVGLPRRRECSTLSLRAGASTYIRVLPQLPPNSSVVRSTSTHGESRPVFVSVTVVLNPLAIRSNLN